MCCLQSVKVNDKFESERNSTLSLTIFLARQAISLRKPTTATRLLKANNATLFTYTQSQTMILYIMACPCRAAPQTIYNLHSTPFSWSHIEFPWAQDEWDIGGKKHIQHNHCWSSDEICINRSGAKSTLSKTNNASSHCSVENNLRGRSNNNYRGTPSMGLYYKVCGKWIGDTSSWWWQSIRWHLFGWSWNENVTFNDINIIVILLISK